MALSNSEIDIFYNSSSIDSLINVKNVRFFRGDYQEGYQVFNASLLNKDGDIKMLLRNSSFDVGNILNSPHLGQESHISIAKIFGNRMTRPQKLEISGIRGRTPFEYNGLEDPRYFIWRGTEFALCVEPNKKLNGSRVVLVNIEEKTYTPLEDIKNRPWNKNWMPYVKSDELFIVSDVFPTIVYKFDDNGLQLIHETQAGIPDFVIHGSSNVFNYDGTKTALVHGRIHMPVDVDKGFWFYWHAFVQWPQDNWQEVRMGKTFFFESKQIEFCTSIIEYENDFLMTYSANDWGMNILAFDRNELDKLL